MASPHHPARPSRGARRARQALRHGRGEHPRPADLPRHRRRHRRAGAAHAGRLGAPRAGRARGGLRRRRGERDPLHRGGARRPADPLRPGGPVDPRPAGLVPRDRRDALRRGGRTGDRPHQPGRSGPGPHGHDGGRRAGPGASYGAVHRHRARPRLRPRRPRHRRARPRPARRARLRARPSRRRRDDPRVRRPGRLDLRRPRRDARSAWPWSARPRARASPVSGR